MKKPSFALLVLLLYGAFAPLALAGRMLPVPFVIDLEPGIDYTFEKVIFKTPLFKTSPFSAPVKQAVPGFADPLGIGTDKKLSVFSGVVQFMDLLGDFSFDHEEDVASATLPPNALKGLDIRDGLLDEILSGKRRAFDSGLLNVEQTEVREIDGRPVTAETSPLSLAGYGTVTEYLKPVRKHWTECPSVEKRVRVMDEVPRKLQKKYQPKPSTCYAI